MEKRISTLRRQAAEALCPIAGAFASLLFSLGVIGTGLLALPVLGGSAAYAVGEALHWSVGLERKAKEAKAFYAVLALATLVGLALNFTKVDAIKAPGVGGSHQRGYGGPSDPG
jgi:Mn2+/Fe2+ NRAMP family transporter